MIRKATMVTGRLTGPRTVRLDEAVGPTDAPVEVYVPGDVATPSTRTNRLSDFLRSLPLRGVPKEELDRQLREERDSWGDR